MSSNDWNWERWYVPIDREREGHYVSIGKKGALVCSCHLFNDTGECPTAVAVKDESAKHAIPDNYMSFITPYGTMWCAQFLGRNM